MIGVLICFVNVSKDFFVCFVFFLVKIIGFFVLVIVSFVVFKFFFWGNKLGNVKEVFVIWVLFFILNFGILLGIVRIEIFFFV